MQKQVVIRAMRSEDITAVLDIQSHCYDESKLESKSAFLAKLSVAPESCFIASMGDAVKGYLVAVPAQSQQPPALNHSEYAIPAQPDALYLHDLAVHPSARGAGVADALIDSYFQQFKRTRYQYACLTAVNNASGFWERYGFRHSSCPSHRAKVLRSYGEGADYMIQSSTAASAING